MKTIIGKLIGVLLIVLVIGMVYGIAMVSKKISYNWWYKSQVEQTVYEVLEKEGLIVEAMKDGD